MAPLSAQAPGRLHPPCHTPGPRLAACHMSGLSTRAHMCALLQGCSPDQQVRYQAAALLPKDGTTQRHGCAVRSCCRALRLQRGQAWR
jgi:hypothetical protein